MQKFIIALVALCLSSPATTDLPFRASHLEDMRKLFCLSPFKQNLRDEECQAQTVAKFDHPQPEVCVETVSIDISI